MCFIGVCVFMMVPQPHHICFDVHVASDVYIRMVKVMFERYRWFRDSHISFEIFFSSIDSFDWPVCQH